MKIDRRPGWGGAAGSCGRAADFFGADLFTEADFAAGRGFAGGGGSTGAGAGLGTRAGCVAGVGLVMGGFGFGADFPGFGSAFGFSTRFFSDITPNIVAFRCCGDPHSNEDSPLKAGGVAISKVWHYSLMRRAAILIALLMPALASAQTPATGQALPRHPETITLDDGVAIQATSNETIIASPLLEVLPVESRFAFGAMLLLPGVNPNNFSTYGSGGESSHTYRLDGANVNDPESGATWVFANYNWIQELKIVGLGADAEHGGFTGVAANIVLRTGTNAWRGLFESLFQNDSFRSSNVPDETLGGNPQLAPPKNDYTSDTSMQLGGPIRRDRAWFFAGAEYNRPKSTPAGFPATRTTGYPSDNGPTAHVESSPRFLFKPTFAPSDTSRIEGFVEADMSSAEAYGAAANVAPSATLRQQSPEAAWNGSYARVLGRDSLLAISYSGFRGSFELKPYNGDTPGWYDADEDYYAVNAFYHYKADRLRHQTAANVTAYAGAHRLKGGLEFERSGARSDYGYNGGRFIEASFGRPYFAYLYDGYAKDDTSTGISAFFQDEWTRGEHFALNPGVRFDRIRGSNSHLGDQVFATNSIAPRIGFAWTAGANVIRGHYGWYFDAARTSFFDLVDPQINPIYGVDVDSRLNPTGAVFIDTPGRNHTVHGGLQQPRMQQATIGIERWMFGMALAVTGIYRRNDHFADDVLQFAPADFGTLVTADPGPDGTPGNTDDTTQTVTLYRQRTSPLNNQYLITNPDGAFRQYQGVQIAATRLGERWQMHASYVLSRTTGNYDNVSNAGNDPSEYNDPNTDPRVQPLRAGRLTHDNTHLAKAMGTYRAPLRLLLSAVFYYTSGDTFTRTVRTTRTQTPQGRLDVFVEPRGSSRYDQQPRLDARVERRFGIGGGSLGLTLEGFNVLNDAAVTSQTTRAGLLYGAPRALVAPRRLRVGATYRF